MSRALLSLAALALTAGLGLAQVVGVVPQYPHLPAPYPRLAPTPSNFAGPAWPNLLFVHYNDLKEDLAGEMRRISDFLGIDTPESLLPSLVEAAGFAAMKKNGAIRSSPHARPAARNRRVPHGAAGASHRTIRTPGKAF